MRNNFRFRKSQDSVLVKIVSELYNMKAYTVDVFSRN